MSEQVSVTHRPSGRMCSGCAKNTEDCSTLPFDMMPILRADTDGTKVVRCTRHLKSTANGPSLSFGEAQAMVRKLSGTDIDQAWLVVRSTESAIRERFSQGVLHSNVAIGINDNDPVVSIGGPAYRIRAHISSAQCLTLAGSLVLAAILAPLRRASRAIETAIFAGKNQ